MDPGVFNRGSCNCEKFDGRSWTENCTLKEVEFGQKWRGSFILYLTTSNLCGEVYGLGYLDLFLFNLSSIRLTKVITLGYFRQLELHDIF